MCDLLIRRVFNHVLNEIFQSISDGREGKWREVKVMLGILASLLFQRVVWMRGDEPRVGIEQIESWFRKPFWVSNSNLNLSRITNVIVKMANIFLHLIIESLVCSLLSARGGTNRQSNTVYCELWSFFLYQYCFEKWEKVSSTTEPSLIESSVIFKKFSNYLTWLKPLRLHQKLFSWGRESPSSFRWVHFSGSRLNVT